MSPIEVHPAVAAWAAKVAEALGGLGNCETDHGAYYLGPAPVMFDNEPTGVSVGPSEFGTVSVFVAAPGGSDTSPERELADLRGAIEHLITHGITANSAPADIAEALRGILDGTDDD